MKNDLKIFKKFRKLIVYFKVNQMTNMSVYWEEVNNYLDDLGLSTITNGTPQLADAIFQQVQQILNKQCVFLT